jgi:hypothetical protein
VVEHSLGKGEVHSSILCGSTSKISNKQAILAEAPGALDPFHDGTEREDDGSISGKSVEFVRATFCASSDQ